ncbi:Hypothetical protein PHPALM_36517 [Phytophthora palmivora]|uniref:Uncharacterized protein n=1 Tax=Phytophthora palmivora TaxID=4796 RepID=A0A2P4WZU0_9STRA|nr:Hypothetical protein PHPALM_36517 [Phytophthora palmivora]
MDIETTKRLPDRLDLRLLEDLEEDTVKEDEVGAGGKAGENAEDDESGDAEQENDGHFGRDSDDDEVISESNAAELDEAFVEALHIGNDDTSKAAKQQRSATLRGMRWSQLSGSFEKDTRPYPGLNLEEAHPIVELRSLCHSPLLTFFYFLPKSMWVSINVETNRSSSARIGAPEKF